MRLIEGNESTSDKNGYNFDMDSLIRNLNEVQRNLDLLSLVRADPAAELLQYSSAFLRQANNSQRYQRKSKGHAVLLL